jgi:DNA-binding IclR family transcriptional regulator
VLSKLRDFLYFLAEDGQWHSLNEVTKATGLSEQMAEKIARHYADFNFVTFNAKARRVRIDPKLKELLTPEAK